MQISFFRWVRITVTAAALLLLSGCALTNRERVASPIQLDTAQMMETAAAETPVQNGGMPRERFQAPETYQFEAKKGNVTLSIDAVVSVPNTAAVPVVRTSGTDFSQDQVDKVLSLLWRSEIMWDNNPPLTKAQIEEQIASIEYNLETLPDDQNERDYFERVRLPELRDMLKTAPETDSPVRSDGKLAMVQVLDAGTDRVVASGTKLSIHGDSGQFFSVSNNYDNTLVIENTRFGRLAVKKWAMMRYQREQDHGAYLLPMIISNASPVSPDDSAIPEMPSATISQSPAEAAALVRDFFSALGEDGSIRDMLLFSDAGKGAYLIRCVRNVKGIPMILMDGESTALNIQSEDEELPDAVWANETITLVVNQDGILQLSWDSPHALGETLVEECTLLPFTEVMEVGIKMLPLLFDEQWGHIKDMTNATILVDSIEFGMMRVVKNQSIDEGLLVPVWALYGSEPFESASFGKQNQPKKQPKRLLTINAIDGTVVEPLG